MTEQELVKGCLLAVCSKTGFNDAAGLTQRDLELVSRELEEKTGTLISTSTLRRLLHGEFSRMPQTATLNALAGFLGYKQWQEYKTSVLQPPVASNNHSPANGTAAVKPGVRTTRWKWIGGAVVLVAGIIVFFSFIKGASKPVINYTGVHFSANKTTSNEVPNTVVFNYNVENLDADSFFIQQSWDRNRRVKIDKHRHTLTDIYYEPGYHIAKLIANEEIIKAVDVSIPTNGWVYYAVEAKALAQPQYIPDPGSTGNLTISKNALEKNLIDYNTDHHYCIVNFPSVIEHPADSFKMKCRVKVNPVKNNACPFLMCEIYCQRYFMYVKTRSKGCAHEIWAQFGEREMYGDNTDLSALASNVLEWQDIEISIVDKQVSVRINDKQVFTTSYTQSAGNITGFGFISDGLPEVQYIDCKTTGGKPVYVKDFSAKQ